MTMRHGKDPADRFKDPPSDEAKKLPPPRRYIYDELAEMEVHPEKLITRIIERTYGPIARYTEVPERLISRCSEMFLEIDFGDSIDWRQRINHRRVELARKYLLARFPEPPRASAANG